MHRRQLFLTVLFGLLFQIFFSTTNGNQPLESIENNATNRCEPASIDEFPPLFFSNEQRRRGGILVHIALMLYSFAAIEIVCDDYFASALEKISYNLNLTPVRRFGDMKASGSFFFRIGCGRSNVSGLSNLGLGIFYIDSGCFLC